MHIRFRITFLFTFIMMLLLALGCYIVYNFSHTSRLENMQYQLTNQALTTARMLRSPTDFPPSLMKRIDAGNVLPLEAKSIDVYDSANNNIYHFNQQQQNSKELNTAELIHAKNASAIFLTDGIHDSLFLYEPGQKIMIITAGYDARGKKNLAQLQRVLLLILVGGTLLAFTCGYYFSKSLLRPLKNIADEVKSISAKNLTQRIRPGTPMDEWKYLVETLNELLDRLQESFEVQRRFVTSVSHELNTPLTSISSQLDVALQRERSVDYYQSIIGSVFEDVRQLSKLTQTLLEFATLSGSPGGIELTQIRMDELLASIPAEISREGNGCIVNLTFLKVPAEDKGMLVFGNEALLLTAIRNIVTNACKYSKDKTAHIELSVEDTVILISVSDNGIGIPVHELENIFRPFYRTEDTQLISGFGVGLPLVKRIIQIHRGDITVRSIVGKGTTFIIRLPVGKGS